MINSQKAWQLKFKSVAGSIQLKKKNVLVCFNSAVPNFKLKINNMIEFKTRGNGLLEARGNGSMMFNKFQYVDFENMVSILIDSIEKNCYEIN